MNDSQRDFQRAKIRLAVNEALDDRLDQIDQEIGDHEDDAQYAITAAEVRWTKHEIQRGIRSGGHIKPRRLLILVAVVLFVFLTIVGALYKPWKLLFLQDAGDHTKIFTTTDWEDAYEPTSFPGSCTQRSIQIARNQRIISYSVDGKPMLFYQCDESSAGFDTEITENAKPVHAEGFEGWLADNNGELCLYWAQGDYMLSLLGNFSADELVETALSVQIKNKGVKNEDQTNHSSPYGCNAAYRQHRSSSTSHRRERPTRCAVR